MLVRATAVTTGGAFSLFEELRPLTDTPMHVHAHEDELFYVLGGEHVFVVGARLHPCSTDPTARATGRWRRRAPRSSTASNYSSPSQ
jgi:hypothetical protein